MGVSSKGFGGTGPEPGTRTYYVADTEGEKPSGAVAGDLCFVVSSGFLYIRRSGLWVVIV